MSAPLTNDSQTQQQKKKDDRELKTDLQWCRKQEYSSEFTKEKRERATKLRRKMRQNQTDED